MSSDAVCLFIGFVTGILSTVYIIERFFHRVTRVKNMGYNRDPIGSLP